MSDYTHNWPDQFSQQAERDSLKALLKEARAVLERAGSMKMADGTYFDKDCSVSLLVPRIDAALASGARDE